jgi:archaetidylinositol phosphate synthase
MQRLCMPRPRHTYTGAALSLSGLVSSKLKKRFEGLVAAGIKPFADAGVTPNMVTILGLFVSLASAWCYYSWGSSPLLLPAAGTLVLVSGLFDAVDGVIARTTGKVTTFGGFFDSVSDRYADAFVLAGVTLGGLCNPIAGFAALIGSLMVSYTRSRAEAAGVAMGGVGLGENSDSRSRDFHSSLVGRSPKLRCHTTRGPLTPNSDTEGTTLP